MQFSPRVWIVGVAAVTAIVFLLLANSLKGPRVSRGDAVEQRTCRSCDGSGVETGASGRFAKEGAVCFTCAGEKTVKVVIPGPDHPTTILGTLQCEGHPPESQKSQGPLGMPRLDRLGPPPGPVVKGKITVTGGSKPVTVEASAGRFRATLVPGSYHLSVDAEGYLPLVSAVKVERIQGPIIHDRLRDLRLEPRPDELRLPPMFLKPKP